MAIDTDPACISADCPLLNEPDVFPRQPVDLRDLVEAGARSRDLPSHRMTEPANRLALSLRGVPGSGGWPRRAGG